MRAGALSIAPFLHITVVASDASLRYVSPSIQRVLGYVQEALIGTDFASLLHPDDAAQMKAFVTEALTSPTTPRAIWGICYADGSWRHVESVGCSSTT